MQIFKFNLGKLFEDTFGYRSAAFSLQMNATDTKVAISENAAGGAPYYTKDVLGREYYLPVKLTYNQEKKIASKIVSGIKIDDTKVLGTKSFDLPYPIISISSKKKIVETVLIGRKGTAKELISCQDYEINIKGFLISENGLYPEKLVKELRDIFELNSTIAIANVITDIFLLRPDRTGSDEVVLKELKLTPIKGVKNIVAYELNMVSDEPFNLTTIE